MDALTLPIDSQQMTTAAAGESSRTNAVLQETRKVQAAKDFEALLVGKLVDSMKETVGESGLLEDEGSEQMQAMFWMHMTTGMSQQGGIGLWKDIYKSIYGTAPGQQSGTGEMTRELDRTI